MGSNLLFVGVDVDDKSFKAAALGEVGDEFTSFVTAPAASYLIKKLKTLESRGFSVRLCYEATYLGFSLYRELNRAGFKCDVIAPSLIPDLAGKKVKTDRLDAQKLAKYYRANLLTRVEVPEEEDEAARDFIRARKRIVLQLVETKNFINSQCRRLGWNYKSESERKALWTDHHERWLEQKVNECEQSVVARQVALLMRHYQYLKNLISEFNQEIITLSEKPKYKARVEALNTFRGLNTLSSLTITVELGDIKRFKHPAHLVGYVGLNVVEYSSGGRERKFGVSCMGNRHVRTTIVEAAQLAMRTPKTNRSLRKRRDGVDLEITSIADRCMARLYTKGTRLLMRDKNRNKVKVACAREMIGFLWEALNKVS